MLVKEYQLDPITRHFLHADFYRVAMDKALTVDVSVVLEGEPKGVKQQGGVLDFVTREVSIECLPGDIPEHIVIDVSELMLNEGVRSATWRRTSSGRPSAISTRCSSTSSRCAWRRSPRLTRPSATTPAEPEVAKKGKTDKDEDKA